jgi:choline transport protein
MPLLVYIRSLLTSYLGWLTLVAWIAACALTPFVLGTVVQALIIFNNADYVPQRWHATLIMWCFVLLPVVWNV